MHYLQSSVCVAWLTYSSEQFSAPYTTSPICGTQVYRARCKPLDSIVAVKKLLLDCPGQECDLVSSSSSSGMVQQNLAYAAAQCSAAVEESSAGCQAISGSDSSSLRGTSSLHITSEAPESVGTHRRGDFPGNASVVV